MASSAAEAVESLADAAREFVRVSTGLTMTSGTEISFARGLRELEAALGGNLEERADALALAAAATRIVESSAADNLIKSRGGARLVGALRHLRSELREVRAELGE
jgi:hypothetical protein